MRHAVVGCGLERVADGVAVVQQHAELAEVALVGRHDLRLEGDATGDHRQQHQAIEGQQRIDVLLDLLDQARGDGLARHERTLDHRVFHDFGEGSAPLALGFVAQQRRIGPREARVVERAHEIARALVVERRLAADRRVDHAFERRGDLHERDATHVGRGHESAEVVDRVAADDQHDVFAPHAQLEQPVVEQAGLVERLDVLVGLDLADVDLEAGFLQ